MTSVTLQLVHDVSDVTTMLMLRSDFMTFQRHMSGIVSKPDSCLCETEVQTAQLIRAFVFATLLVQFLFFINPKFQDSRLLL